jgi:hypothetical protein
MANATQIFVIFMLALFSLYLAINARSLSATFHMPSGMALLIPVIFWAAFGFLSLRGAFAG